MVQRAVRLLFWGIAMREIGEVRMRVTQPRKGLKLTGAYAASMSEQAYPSDFS